MKSWYEEEEPYWDYSKSKGKPGYEDSFYWGHFTQVVWK